MGRVLLVLECEDDKRKAISWIGKAPIGTRVEFKASKRTLPQNDLLWALLTEVSQQLDHGGKRYEPGQWKAIFLHAFGREVSFLPSLDGKTFLPIELSSSDLSKDEMTDLIEFIIKEGTERGVTFREHNNDNLNPDEESPPPSSVDGAPPSAPEADAVPPETSASPLSDAECAWLVVVARMLWACTPEKPTEATLEVLNNQRVAAGHERPEQLSEPARLKAGSIYFRCKETVEGKHARGDTLRYIAGIAGCDVSEIGG